jgi:hypothetical protein
MQNILLKLASNFRDNLQFIEDGLVQEDLLDEIVLLEMLLSFGGHDGLEGLDDFLLNNLDFPGDGVDNLVDLFVEEGLGVGVGHVLEVIDVDLSLDQVHEDFLQVELGGFVGGHGIEWSLDLLSHDSSECWIDFLGCGGHLGGHQNVQNVPIVHLLPVDLAVVSIAIDFWVHGLDGVEFGVEVEQLVVVLWQDLLVEHIIVVDIVVQIVVHVGEDILLITSIIVVVHLLLLLSTEDFWDSDDSIVLLLLMLILDDDGEDVFVEEGRVDKELFEFGLSPIFLEGWADNVLLEGWDVQEEFPEKRNLDIVLEQGKSVQLTEGIDEDVGGHVDLLTCCGWQHHLLLTLGGGGGHVSGIDCLLQLLDVVVQGSCRGESTLVLSLVLLLTLELLTLRVHGSVPQVVHDVLVHSSGHLTADGGDQQNSNKSLHDDENGFENL